MTRRLLIVFAVVLALSLASMFLPARQLSIEGIGWLSFKTNITLSVGSGVAYAAPDTQTRYPTGDADVNGTWTLTPSGGSRYEKVDETPASDSDYITLTTAAGGYSYFSFTPAFSVPTGSTVNNVTVYYRHRDAAAISYIGSANATGNNPLNGSFSLPGGWAAGDTAIFWWYTYADNKTFTAPAGVTQKQQASSVGYGRIYIGYRVLQAGDTTFSWTSSNVFNSTTIWGTSVFRGVDTSGDPFEAESGAPATFTNAVNPNPPSVATVSSNAWVIPIFGKRNDYTSIAPPANYTAAGSNSSTAGSDASAGVAYRQIATPGPENPGAWTLGGGNPNDDGYVWTGALRPITASNTRAALGVGGVLYGNVDTGADPTASWADRSYVFTANPQTGSAWTVDDINGTGANPLQAFGVNSSDSSPNISISQCYIVVDYTTPSATGWLCGWENRVRLTIDHNDITGPDPLADFPVLLYLSTASGRGADNLSFVFNEIQSDANRLKIAVTTSDGETECYVEVEKWIQATQQAWLWVRVPAISNTADTDLYLYYDRTHTDNTDRVGDTNSAVAEQVWDGSYALVQHLAQNDVVLDSTANSNDETNPPPDPPSGDPNPGYVRATYTDSGRQDGGYSFSNGSRIQMNHSDSLDITEAITLEVFVYLNDRSDGKFIAKDDPFPGGSGCYCLQQETNNLELMLDFGGWYRASYGTYSTGQWLYLVGTYDRQTMRLYLNGVEVATNPQTSAISSFPNVYLALGNRAYDVTTQFDLNGLLDEVRISNTPRSVGWIYASYESGRDNLVDYGAAEIYPADMFNNPSSLDFGVVAPDSEYWANGTTPTFPLQDSQCFFTITNNGDCAIKIQIRATNFTGDSGWTLTTGPPFGLPDQVRMKAGGSGINSENDMVILTTSDQDFILSLGALQSQGWELKLETGTFTDETLKTSTITLTASSA